jgi:hypothetical protein
MKKLSFLMPLGVVLGLIILTYGEGPNTAQAKPTNDKYTDSFTLDFFNDCTGENVSFTVIVKTFAFNSVDANGGIHGHFVQQWHCTGVGETSGIKYVGPQTDHGDSYESGDGVFVGTYTANWEIIGQGGADNLLGRVRSHITINPNGEVTRTFDSFTIECKG